VRVDVVDVTMRAIGHHRNVGACRHMIDRLHGVLHCVTGTDQMFQQFLDRCTKELIDRFV